MDNTRTCLVCGHIWQDKNQIDSFDDGFNGFPLEAVRNWYLDQDAWACGKDSMTTRTNIMKKSVVVNIDSRSCIGCSKVYTDSEDIQAFDNGVKDKDVNSDCQAWLCGAYSRYDNEEDNGDDDFLEEMAFEDIEFEPMRTCVCGSEFRGDASVTAFVNGQFGQPLTDEGQKSAWFCGKMQDIFGNIEFLEQDAIATQIAYMMHRRELAFSLKETKYFVDDYLLGLAMWYTHYTPISDVSALSVAEHLNLQYIGLIKKIREIGLEILAEPQVTFGMQIRDFVRDNPRN